jgi:hypothetical protein
LSSGSGINDDPGKVRPGADILNAHFTSYLIYSSKWQSLTDTDRDDFKRNLAIKRVTMPIPDSAGYFQSDRTYSAGGQSINRATLRPN